MSVAYVLGSAFRLKRSQRSFAMAAAMFMNSNSLPIALMQSLVVTVPDLKWDKHDTKSEMIGRALTYLVLHSTLGMVLRWSYGVRLLAAADDDVEIIPQASGLDTGLPAPPDTPTLEHTESAFSQSYSDHPTQWPAPDSSSTPPSDDFPHPRPTYTGPPILVQTPSNRLLRPTASRRSTGVFHSFPNSPAPSPPAGLPSIPPTPSTSSSRAGSPDAALASDEFGRPVHRSIRGPSAWRSFKKRAAHAWATFSDFMTAPLWAAAASLVVALVPTLQHTLDAHLPPVKNALNAAGQCSIPVTLIVLGAYFYTPPEESTGQIRLEGAEPDLHTATNGEGATERAAKRMSQVSLVGSVRSMFKLDSFKGGRREENGGMVAPERDAARPGETRTVIVAVLSRMVVTPLLLLPGMALSAYFDWHQVLEDPVFVVSNVLLIASPPALTLAQITQAASGDAFERLISRTIFWSYCIVTPPSTILFVVVGLMLSKL
jgi:predicted permease